MARNVVRREPARIFPRQASRDTDGRPAGFLSWPRRPGSAEPANRADHDATSARISLFDDGGYGNRHTRMRTNRHVPDAEPSLEGPGPVTNNNAPQRRRDFRMLDGKKAPHWYAGL